MGGSTCMVTTQILIPSKSVLVIGRGPQFLPTWTSLKWMTGVLITCHLASPIPSKPKKVKTATSCMTESWKSNCFSEVSCWLCRSPLLNVKKYCIGSWTPGGYNHWGCLGGWLPHVINNYVRYLKVFEKP